VEIKCRFNIDLSDKSSLQITLRSSSKTQKMINNVKICLIKHQRLELRPAPKAQENLQHPICPGLGEKREEGQAY